MLLLLIIMLLWCIIGYVVACLAAPKEQYILDNKLHIIIFWPVYLIFAGFYWLICAICWKIEDLRR